MNTVFLKSRHEITHIIHYARSDTGCHYKAMVAQNLKSAEKLAEDVTDLANIAWAWNQWCGDYGYPLYVLETFVDRSRFRGTCYKAANWIRVGKTKGHAKKSVRFYYHGLKKDVYLYPLVRNFRERLKASVGEGGVR